LCLIGIIKSKKEAQEWYYDYYYSFELLPAFLGERERRDY
jgi:hypothetical protein